MSGEGVIVGSARSFFLWEGVEPIEGETNDAHSARLCVLTPPTDLGPGVCQPGVPRCATSGTVVLSAPPSPVSGLAGLRVAAEGAWGVSSLTLTQ